MAGEKSAPLKDLQRVLAEHQAGQWERAADGYSRLLARYPEDPHLWHYRGLLHLQAGQFLEAVELISRAVSLAGSGAPPEFLLNLGNAHKRAGQWQEAKASYERAQTLRPDWPPLQFNLGLLLAQMGDHTGALAALAPLQRQSEWAHPVAIEVAESESALGHDQAAVAALSPYLNLQPAAVRASVGLLRRAGRLLVLLARYEAAIPLLKNVLEAVPDDSDSLNVLGCALSSVGLLTDAEACFLEAERLAPGDMRAVENLANLLKDAGRHGEALDRFSRLIQSGRASSDAWSNYLFSMLYSDSVTEEQIRAAHLAAIPAVSGSFAEGVPTLTRPVPERIRIAYLSGDFRNHPVAYFVDGLLRHHDGARVEVLIYDNSPVSDDWTQRLKRYGHRWQHVRADSDGQLVERIRKDGVDVLIELSGHTAENRLAALAGRAAPFQLSYLGYPADNGLPWIDGQLSDLWCDPATEDYGDRKILRLPRSYYAYTPPPDSPSVFPQSEASDRGALTFGAFTNLAKVSPTTLDHWATVLTWYPESRLYWRARQFLDVKVRARFTEALVSRGVESSRLDLVPWATHGSRWDALRRVDVALDTFPYNQATNTCEALWMGVPVISISGNSHRSRMGRSVLQAAGLPEWVFDHAVWQHQSETCRVRLDRLLQPEALAAQRGTLRDQLMESSLLDCQDAATAIESICLDLFHECAT